MALEALTYHQLGALRGSLFAWAERFHIEPRLLAAILLTERQQYHLPEALRAIHRAGHGILDLIGMASKSAAQYIDTTKGWSDLCAWLNCSRGFCRIKWETAETAWRMHKARGGTLIDERIICHHTLDADLSIAVSGLILDELARQWEPHFPTIRGDVEILATLYNVSDFTNKPPHPNPAPGGSVLRSVVDGVEYIPEPFGIRAGRIYHSKMMGDFLCR